MVSGPVPTGRGAYASTMTTDAPPTADGAAAAPVKPKRRALRRARQVQRVITRVDVRSVLRVSLGFAVSLWLIIDVAGIVMWQVAIATGTISKAEDFMAQLLAEKTFSFNGLTVLVGAALLGAVLVAGAFVFTALFAVLFNLIAGAVGGIRFTMVELETAEVVEVPAEPAPAPAPSPNLPPPPSGPAPA